MENALIAYRTDQTTATRIADTVNSAALSHCISRLAATRTAWTTYLPVLVSNRTLVTARQQLDQANLAVADDIVTLYTALGGGWQTNLAWPDIRARQIRRHYPRRWTPSPIHIRKREAVLFVNKKNQKNFFKTPSWRLTGRGAYNALRLIP